MRVAVGEEIGLWEHLVLTRSEAAGGRSKGPILGRALEAVMAALYLDGGLLAAKAFVERYWDGAFDGLADELRDAKTALQEWAQGLGLPLPVYRLIASEGPPHDPTFEMEVSLPGRTPAQGRGRSRRAAESAAANALFSPPKG